MEYDLNFSKTSYPHSNNKPKVHQIIEKVYKQSNEVFKNKIKEFIFAGYIETEVIEKIRSEYPALRHYSDYTLRGHIKICKAEISIEIPPTQLESILYKNLHIYDIICRKAEQRYDNFLIRKATYLRNRLIGGIIPDAKIEIDHTIEVEQESRNFDFSRLSNKERERLDLYLQKIK